MKSIKAICQTVAAVAVLTAATSYGETVHQSLNGTDARTGENAKAVEKNVMEVKSTPDGEIARVVGSVNQWGYVNYWFGLPAPAGKSVIRLKLWVDDPDLTSAYAIYVKREGQDPLVCRIKLPADVKKDSMVTVDIPVDVPQEWNCATLKKIVNNDKPSYWIRSISTVLE
ncbi:MAG: hypothetical protein LBK60_00570 [Verrucomicrobiales bacterium]|jgi:hypothetical protein|nr:hypothetical protein [Verrucomicrobiales bacterium]